MGQIFSLNEILYFLFESKSSFPIIATFAYIHICAMKSGFQRLEHRRIWSDFTDCRMIPSFELE